FCPVSCSIVDVTADYVYLSTDPYADSPPEYSLVVNTRQVRSLKPGSYVDDLVGKPRGLVVGGTWESGVVSNGIGQLFSVVGSQLTPLWHQSEGVLTSAFDTATGHAVELQ